MINKLFIRVNKMGKEDRITKWLNLNTNLKSEKLKKQKLRVKYGRHRLKIKVNLMVVKKDAKV
jgi:hypothetical protein